MTHRSRLTLTALTLIAAGAFAPQAQASGFQLREQSPSSQGNAYAGVSAGGNDISALFFNPAVMTQYDGWQFSLGGTYVGLDVKLDGMTATRTPALTGLGFNVYPNTTTSLMPVSGPSSHGNSGQSAILPEFNIMYSASKDLKLGLSVNVPFGLTTEYDANWIGRYHGLKSDLKVIDITPSLAYRVNDQFSFGVAFIARYADAELTNGVDYGTALALKVGSGLAAAGMSPVAPSPTQNSPVATVAMGAPNATFGTPGYAIPGAWDGKAGLKGNGWDYGWKAGFTWQPTKDFRLGAAYSAAVTMTLKGDATFEYPASMPSTDLAALQGAGLRNGKGQADLALPATASLGFDWQVDPAFSFQGEVARSTWSRFKELRVKFDTGLADSVTDESWRDTWFYSLGGTWKMDSTWTFRAGVGFDQGAVDDNHRTPRIPDNDRKWLSVGLSYAFSKKMSMDVGYTHLFISDAKINLTSAGDNLTRGSLNATMKASIEILGAQLRYSF
ncbi:OmpP1/FadL family transporter [Geothrix paludis]|uniref:OmpP1/FadL family transporter n=1 Tax=Geothrix paludis TaxID=2922722 RepID=UPI001FAC0732|nr:outer membrane protein transport protein [Geothrix paludis]